MMDVELMERAMAECFGRDISQITFQTIDQTLEAIRISYEELEIK